MWLHLGNEFVIDDREIIGVFDMDNTTVSPHTRRLLARMQKENRVVNVSAELPKSFVVCRRNGQTLVYITQVSSNTLLKRSLLIYKFE